jgi:hypothetical protein
MYNDTVFRILREIKDDEYLTLEQKRELQVLVMEFFISINENKNKFLNMNGN